MFGILILKIIFSVFLFNWLFRYGLKYIELAFRIVDQDQLHSHFRQAWVSSFWMLLSIFGLFLVWFPTVLQSNFLSNPVPTLVVAVLASVFLATALAKSAKDASESVNFWRRVRDGLGQEKKSDEKDK
ncbi:MAG: hypothetical protein QM730_29070 [Anaerolineales bacterium]